MSVSGGAVSPENRNNEEIRAENFRLRNEILGWESGAAFVRAERDAALARIAAVEAKLRPSALFDALYDAMYGSVSVNAEEREAVAQLAESLGAALAASPTPTGPEPATACDHGRTRPHYFQAPPPITGADIWHCPGPATPEPIEETP